MDRTYRTALMGRTSKDDPRRVPIENQQKDLRQWALDDPFVNRNFPVLEFWDVGVSGTIPLQERPAGGQLVHAVERKEIECLAVPYADRFGRTLFDGLESVRLLERHGVKLVTVNEGWDARKQDTPMWFQMRLLMAEEEWRRIKERTEKGKKRFMEEKNTPPNGQLVFGYRFDEQGRFVLYPPEAEIVIQIFEMYLAGKPLCYIRRWLEERSVTVGNKFQKRGMGSQAVLASDCQTSRLHDATVHHILTNRTYIGERKWGSRVFECLPIIPRAAFEQAQQLMLQKRNRWRTQRGSAEDGLLSGLLTCGLCRSKIYASNVKSKQRTRSYWYRKYVCNSSRKHGYCACKTFGQRQLDQAVWEQAERYLANPGKFLAKVTESADRVQESNEELLPAEANFKETIQSLEKQVQAIWQQQEENDLPIEWVTPKLQKLKKLKDEATESLNAVRRKMTDSIQDQRKLEELQSSLLTIRSRLKKGLSASEKKAILEILIAKATVQTEGHGHSKRGEVEILFRWGESVSTPSFAHDVS